MVGSGLALSACLPSNGICRLYLRRRSALSIAHAAWDRRSAAKSRDFAEVAICASLPFVISAANFRFPEGFSMRAGAHRWPFRGGGPR